MTLALSIFLSGCLPEYKVRYAETKIVHDSDGSQWLYLFAETYVNDEHYGVQSTQVKDVHSPSGKLLARIYLDKAAGKRPRNHIEVEIFDVDGLGELLTTRSRFPNGFDQFPNDLNYNSRNIGDGLHLYYGYEAGSNEPQLRQIGIAVNVVDISLLHDKHGKLLKLKPFEAPEELEPEIKVTGLIGYYVGKTSEESGFAILFDVDRELIKRIRIPSLHEDR